MSNVRGRRKGKAPTVSQKETETIQEQTFRKSLSILQPAADNATSLVGSCGTSTKKKITKLKCIVDSKENSPMKLRRSKRKATASGPGESKVKSSTPVANDEKISGNINLTQQKLTKYSKNLIAKLKETDAVNQREDKVPTRPDIRLSGISIQSESSGYCSDVLDKSDNVHKSGDSAKDKLTVAVADGVVSSQKDAYIKAHEELENTASVPHVCDLSASAENRFAADEATSSQKEDSTADDEKSQSSASIPQDVYDLLISDKVPESYWKDLAEQRRLALEEALLENEMLRDQLEVLEADNSRLMSIMNDAEKLAELLKDMLDE